MTDQPACPTPLGGTLPGGSLTQRTVADIPDEELLRRVVLNLANQGTAIARHWVKVKDAFGLGSTFSAQLCRRFGVDPDSCRRDDRLTAALKPLTPEEARLVDELYPMRPLVSNKQPSA